MPVSFLATVFTPYGAATAAKIQLTCHQAFSLGWHPKPGSLMDGVQVEILWRSPH